MKGHRSLKKRGAPCPNCGGPVEFRFGSSMVTVCDFCHSAVGRGDRDVEDFGKVSELVETESVVQIGTTGNFRGKPFEVIGRVQYQHAAGGVWDEWYLRLPGDKIAWLAEAQGELHLTFERPVRKRKPLPAFDSLRVGEQITYGDNELTVTEKGVAISKAAQGEIPWAFRPGAEHTYVDLKGSDGWFATFDFTGDQPHTYVGKTVLPSELHLDSPDWQSGSQDGVKKVQALQLNCPKCGGPLELHAPDRTMRVGCPHCSTLLDAEKGNLRVFKTLDSREVHPVIPLGTTGKLDGVEYTVIGFMERFAKYAGQVYPWTEYLLYSPEIGFRWLVRNDSHWSFVRPISPGDVSIKSDRLKLKGDSFKSFRIYDRGTAYVRYVAGEFYWEVSQGETVQTADYIAPPQMISVERSGTIATEEINVSLGTYLTPDEVEQAFKLEKNLLRPWGVGVIQPSPKPRIQFWFLWAAFLAYVIGFRVVHAMVFPAVTHDGWMLFYAILFASVIPVGVIAWLYSFEVTRWRDSDYSPYASSED